MGVDLNHTIVRVRDKRESAQFLVEILGLGDPRPFGSLLAVETGNRGVYWEEPSGHFLEILTRPYGSGG